MSKFRIGDYVRSRRSSARVQQIESSDDVVAFNASGNVHDWERVTVRLAKPRRTLTLSQGLRWLHSMGCKFTLSAYAGPEGGWLIESTSSASWRGDTVLKAIIVARKALGARS